MDVRSNRREAGGQSVITANRLLDGLVVWLTEDGAWRTLIEEAGPIANESIEAAIKARQASAQADGVVGVYGVQVQDGPTGREPITARERIRAFGPSVHPQFAPIAEPATAAARAAASIAGHHTSATNPADKEASHAR